MRGVTRAALAVALGLALVFTLLLANLFCSFRHRRRLHKTAPRSSDATEATRAEAEDHPPISALRRAFYAHGVLQAPTSLLLTTPKLEAAAAPPPKRMESPTTGSDHFVYISNPIFDGASCEATGASDGNGTPFETPQTSPSQLGFEEAGSEWSPPLTLMKKLPPVLPEACATVCLMEGRRSLASSASATETNRVSSSSSNSLCYSPSW